MRSRKGLVTTAAIFAAMSVAAVLAVGAAAHEYPVGSLRVVHPWARATPGLTPTGAVYLTLINDGRSVERLVAAKSPVADTVALHTHRMEQGVMKMRPVAAIETDPGGPAVLEPGGLHIMLIGLRSALDKGETFPLTLTFERAGALEVDVEVQGLGAMKRAHGPGEADS